MMIRADKNGTHIVISGCSCIWNWIWWNLNDCVLNLEPQIIIKPLQMRINLVDGTVANRKALTILHADVISLYSYHRVNMSCFLRFFSFRVVFSVGFCLFFWCSQSVHIIVAIHNGCKAALNVKMADYVRSNIC